MKTNIAAELWYGLEDILPDWRRAAISSGVLKPRGPGKALHLLAGQFAHGQTAKRLKYRRYPRLKTDKPNDLIDEYGIPGG